MTLTTEPLPAPVGDGHGPHARVGIIGTGFAGLGLAIRLRQQGITDVVLFERAGDIGGTWRDNSYPGCQCDVPSHLYSFSFAPNPDWTRSFAPQGEIRDYLHRCARDFGVLGQVRLDHEVLDAQWDATAQRWRIETSQGRYTVDVLVAAHGPLSEPAYPSIQGLDGFEGTTFHSATWDHDHDLSGERVAVIGTGASAIQFIPEIQPEVGRLTVFQRTPPWIMPRPDRRIPVWSRRLMRRFPLIGRLRRAGIYWSRELAVIGMAKRPALMRVAARMATDHLRKQVPDPDLRATLTPDYDIGCKRILLSNEYYPALSQPNVDVVTDGIAEVRAHSVVTRSGVEHPVDTIIFGTGFRVTDHPIGRRIRAADGHSLADEWEGAMEAYLGTTVSGFPNLFVMVGPNTGLGHTSMVVMMEAQFAYILDALATLEREGCASFDVQPSAQDDYNARLQQQFDGTVWSSGCASWYLEADGRNSTLWPSFTFTFRRRTATFDAEHYQLSHRSVTAGR